MPTRRDWADDEAEAVLDQLHEDDPDQADGQLLLDRYAIALRAAEKRGRVAGLREAEQKALWYDGSLHGLALELRSMADKLEAETS